MRWCLIFSRGFTQPSDIDLSRDGVMTRTSGFKHGIAHGIFVVGVDSQT